MICIGMLAVYLPINAYPVSDNEISVNDLGSAEQENIPISDGNGQDGNTDNETGADDASQIPGTAEDQAPPAPYRPENQEELPVQPGTDEQQGVQVHQELLGEDEQLEIQEYPEEGEQQEPQRLTPERELVGSCHSARFAGGMVNRTVQNSSVIVTATYSPSANIPNNATFIVQQLIGQEEQMFTDAVKSSNELPDSIMVNNVVFYYIAFYYGDEKIEPADDVNIHFEYIQMPFSPSETNAADTVTILHFPDAQSEINPLSRIDQVEVDLGNQVIIEDISLVEDVIGRVNVIEPSSAGLDMLEEVSFDTPQFSIFAVALTNTQEAYGLFKRVNSIDDPNANYLIVSVDRSFALSASNSSNFRQVNLVQVYSHPDYYSTLANITPDILFNFSGSGSQFTMRSLTNQYLNIPMVNDNTNGDISFSSDSQLLNANFTNRQTPNFERRGIYTWTIVGDAGSSLVVAANGFSARGMPSASSNPAQHMLIYRQVSYNLTVPPVFQGNQETDVAPQDPFPGPTFPPYRSVSGEVTGHWNWNGLSVHPIHYGSDPSSSQIERDEIFSGSRADDGKIWADKSVIYGADDYDAFTQYDDGTFSVTLSALGQRSIDEYASYEFPLDFVFILDTSGSMNEVVNGQTRAEMLTTALNVSIHTVMRSHPSNRVSIVHYGSAAHHVLDLGRYHVGTSGTPDWNTPVPNYFTASRNGAQTIITPNPNFRNSVTGNNANVSQITVVGATNKQQGIQYGANVLLNNSDTTFSPRPGLVDNRTPVLVLMSDGLPTVGTSNWMDPSRGPVFGTGNNTNGASSGVLGFYTILTANYFKSLVSRHYQSHAMFYTLGFGISASDSAGGPFQDTMTEGAGDEYARAILNPTSAYVALLNQRTTGGPHVHMYGRQLFALLNNVRPLTSWISPISTDNYIQVGAWSSLNSHGATFGVSNSFIPVIENPYLNAGVCFSYATASYTSAELTEARITEMMAKIVGRAPVRDLVVHDMLQPNTTVRFTDYIYSGMEIQGTPVLRFEGVNYQLQQVSSVTESQIRTETYRVPHNTMVRSSTVVMNNAGYQVHVYADLHQAEVRVITQADGSQRLEWNFPESLLPAYRKSFWFDYYFEMLPIRLIYQVGLTEEALMQAVQGIGSTFYAGEWNNRTANVTFSPSVGNPFYATSANISHVEPKTNNITDTLPFSLSKSGSASAVTIQLGNNGRISTDNFVDNALPETGGVGRTAMMFAGFMVILAGGAIFARHNLKNTKKFMGGN